MVLLLLSAFLYSVCTIHCLTQNRNHIYKPHTYIYIYIYKQTSASLSLFIISFFSFQCKSRLTFFLFVFSRRLFLLDCLGLLFSTWTWNKLTTNVQHIKTNKNNLFEWFFLWLFISCFGFLEDFLDFAKTQTTKRVWAFLYARKEAILNKSFFK